MPRQVDHDQRRAEIAVGVIRVIADRGLAAVSLRSVATAAGVSMGRVQHYFASKADLVHHACRFYVAQARGLAAEAPGSLRHLLTMGLPDTSEERIGSAVWYSFVAAAATDPELAEIIREAWGDARHTIDVAVGGDGGPYRADTLAALVDGLTLRVMLGQATPDHARAVIDWHLTRGVGEAE